MRAASCEGRAASVGNRHPAQPRFMNAEKKPHIECGAVRTVRWTVGRVGTLMGRRKAPKAAGTFGSGGRNHPWADEQARSSLEPSAVSNHTRPMSWLGPASSGVYPHTNGAQCFAGGHRHRIPLTTKGLRVARAGKPSGDPSQRAEKCRSAERAGNGSRRSYLQVPWPGTAGRDAHADKKALRAGRPAGRAEHGPRRRWRARLTGNGVVQEPLRPLSLVRRGREAPRLDVPDSTGSVPLQSG